MYITHACAGERTPKSRYKGKKQVTYRACTCQVARAVWFAHAHRPKAPRQSTLGVIVDLMTNGQRRRRVFNFIGDWVVFNGVAGRRIDFSAFAPPAGHLRRRRPFFPAGVRSASARRASPRKNRMRNAKTGIDFVKNIKKRSSTYKTKTVKSNFLDVKKFG